MSMPVLALLFCGAFVLLGVGLRIALMWLRTGSTGVHGYGGSGGRAEALAGAGCTVGSVLIGMVAPLFALDGFVEPVAALERDAVQVAGIAICAVSLVALSYSQLAMGDSWRIGVERGERTSLVVAGPYSLMRNPIYTAWLGLFAGIALLVPSWVALAGALLLLTSMEALVRRVEEPYLVEAHGLEYVRYAARVGRFVPGVGRLAVAEPGRTDG